MLNLTDENISSNITGYFEKIIFRHGGIPSKKIKKTKNRNKNHSTCLLYIQQ